MKKLLDYKIAVVLMAALGLAALGLLAATLRDFTFRPAISLPMPQLPERGGEGNLIEVSASFWEIILASLALIVLLSLLLLLLDKEQRKKVIRRFAAYLLLMIMLGVVLTIVQKALPTNNQLPTPPAPPPPPSIPGDANLANTAVLPPVEPPNPWVGYLVSLGIASGLLALGWFLYRNRPRPRILFAFDEIAGIAREALVGLEDDQNWDDAIVRAYIRMNEAASASRGLIRQPATTPSEFSLRMEQVGLPGEAVRALTRLFEQVRYGGKSSSPQDRELAAAALNAILRACGELA